MKAFQERRKKKEIITLYVQEKVQRQLTGIVSSMNKHLVFGVLYVYNHNIVYNPYIFLK